MGVILILLLVGHLLQMAVWAVGFIRCGEFSDMRTAFYHSSVKTKQNSWTSSASKQRLVEDVSSSLYHVANQKEGGFMRYAG